MASHANDLDERAFRFLCDVMRFARTMRQEPGVRRIADQLVSAAGSVPANRAEATSASSRKEFIRFNEIALRSAKEAALWLRAIYETEAGDPATAESLFDEARQLSSILGAIVVNSKRNNSAERTGP